MNTIAKAMKINITYTLSEKEINWGELYDNGTATGMMAYLLENQCDIGISAQPLTEATIKYLDTGVPYFFQHLAWCVPHASEIAEWEKILKVFSFGSWMLCLFAYITFTFLIWCMSMISVSEINVYKNFIDCVQNAFGVLLGVAIFSVPKSFIVRLLFSFWFIFALHLTIIYKTNMVSRLSNPVYEKQINSVTGMLQSNFRMQFLPGSKKYFRARWHHTQEILDRWIDCIDLSDCVKRVAYTRDSVMLLPDLYVQFIRSKYKKRNKGYYMLHCFNGNIATYPGTMLMRKGFPLRNRINYLIDRTISAGLIDYWTDDSLKNRFKRNSSEPSESSEIIKIKYKEEQPAFVILLVGLMFATLAFLFEILVFKYRHHNISEILHNFQAL